MWRLAYYPFYWWSGVLTAAIDEKGAIHDDRETSLDEKLDILIKRTHSPSESERETACLGLEILIMTVAAKYRMDSSLRERIARSLSRRPSGVEFVRRHMGDTATAIPIRTTPVGVRKSV